MAREKDWDFLVGLEPGGCAAHAISVDGRYLDAVFALSTAMASLEAAMAYAADCAAGRTPTRAEVAANWAAGQDSIVQSKEG